MPTDVVMILIAAIILAACLRFQGAHRGHVITAWVLGIYCGSVSWIGPNVRQFFAYLLGVISAWLTHHH